MKKLCPICGKLHSLGETCKPFVRMTDKLTEQRAFRNSTAWKKKREEIKERDKYLCVYCLRVDKVIARDNLEVHHIVKISASEEGKLQDENLITLCRYHHEMAEKNMISKEELYGLVNKVERGGRIPPEGKDYKKH